MPLARSELVLVAMVEGCSPTHFLIGVKHLIVIVIWTVVCIQFHFTITGMEVLCV